MVENVANFTPTTQNRPSIFEVIAQKSLNDHLHPGLQKVALLLSTNFPKKFHWFNKRYDEVFLVLNLGLQYGYLKRYASCSIPRQKIPWVTVEHAILKDYLLPKELNLDAAFSENFYGLKRILINNQQLSDRHKLISLFYLVCLPYLQRKLNDKIALYRLEDADGMLRNNFEGRCKKMSIYLHSFFEISWSAYTLINFIKYMAGESEYQLPILRFIKIKLIYPEFHQEVGFWETLISGQFRELWKLSMLKSAVTGTFEIVAFFLEFLQSWNTQQANFTFQALPIVKPPMFDGKASNYMGKCPICLQNWKIPTVLPVSGFVFCFPCILRYLGEHNKCPVTELPAKPLDIIRIYDNE